MNILNSITEFIGSTGISKIFSQVLFLANGQLGYGFNLIMIAIACVLIYLAVVKEYEPLLLLPIAFGMLLTNLPISGLYHPEFFSA